MDNILNVVKELCSYPSEREWFEFKHNWFEPEQLGQYISALSNSAATEGRSKAYFVWGIDDTTHDIVGTDFDPDCTVKNEPLKHFLSRGTFPPSQTLEGFFAGESVPVNQKLSEIFLQLHISEKTVRGVPKVIEKYGRDAYEFRENSIVVKIPFRWVNVLGEDNAPEEVKLFKVKDATTPETMLKTTSKDTQEKILKLIAENPRITRKQMAEACGISLDGIKWQIKQLKGKIEFVGSSKTGCWKILSETDNASSQKK